MNWLDTFGVEREILANIIASLLVVIVILALRRVLLHLAFRRLDNAALRYRWRKTSLYIAFVAILALLGPTWIGGIGSAATYFGLLSAGLALALQPLIVNMAGWLFILWRRPFHVGDRIQIADRAGDVIDLRLFQFTLMEIGNWVEADQNTGRIIHVPNGVIFNEMLANYSRGFHYIWNELPVLVTFESNWSQAKAILATVAQRHGAHLSEVAQQHVREASRRFYLQQVSFAPSVYTSVQDSGVLLTIRYLVEPRRRRDSAQAIWEDILRDFAERDDIDFAYPTQRFYNNALEGKQGARATLDLQRHVEQ